LSCLVSSRLVSSRLVSSRLVLSCLVSSCLVVSCLVLYCLVSSCLVSSCLVLSCLVLSRLVSFCLVLSCLVSSRLVLSCPVLSCLVFLSDSSLVLSCLLLSYFDMSCLVLSYLAPPLLPLLPLPSCAKSRQQTRGTSRHQRTNSSTSACLHQCLPAQRPSHSQIRAESAPPSHRCWCHGLVRHLRPNSQFRGAVETYPDTMPGYASLSGFFSNEGVVVVVDLCFSNEGVVVVLDLCFSNEGVVVVLDLCFSNEGVVVLLDRCFSRERLFDPVFVLCSDGYQELLRHHQARQAVRHLDTERRTTRSVHHPGAYHHVPLFRFTADPDKTRENSERALGTNTVHADGILHGTPA
jgi:hypothetical protein